MNIIPKQALLQVSYAHTAGKVATSELYALAEGFESDNPHLVILTEMVERGEVTKDQLLTLADDCDEADKNLDAAMSAVPVLLTGVAKHG
jgi:hypothetical protein